MFTLTAIIIIFISLYFLIKRYLNNRYSYWKRQKVAGYDGFDFSTLMPGHVHETDIIKNKKYGPVYGYYEFFRNGLVMNDPDMIREVFVKNFHIFPDHREIYFGEDSINLNLFNLPGNEDWKRIRNISSPAFTSAKLKNMMTSIELISDTFVQNLTEICDKSKDSNELDMRKYVAYFLIDAINSCAFGIKTNSLKNTDQPIVEFGRKIFAVELKFSLIMALFLPKFAKFLRLEPFSGDAIRYFKDLTHKLIKERTERTDEKNKRTDFLQLMIDANRNCEEINDNTDVKDRENSVETTNSGQSLSKIEMTAQCVLFFIAGMDSTGSALSHTLYCIAKYADIQQKLYEEIKSVEDYSTESLSSLHYLEAVIMESLRLLPPVLRIERVCNQEYVFKSTGIKIPAGTIVSVAPYTLHRDSRFFEDPESFKPERFVGQQLTDPYTFMPFGCGPRLCLGMRFAIVEMKICLIKLIKKFNFKLSPKTKLEYLIGNALFSPKEVVLVLDQRI